MWEILLESYEGVKEKRIVQSKRIEVVLAEIKVLLENYRVIKIIDTERKKYMGCIVTDGSVLK